MRFAQFPKPPGAEDLGRKFSRGSGTSAVLLVAPSRIPSSRTHVSSVSAPSVVSALPGANVTVETANGPRQFTAPTDGSTLFVVDFAEQTHLADLEEFFRVLKCDGHVSLQMGFGEGGAEYHDDHLTTSTEVSVTNATHLLEDLYKVGFRDPNHEIVEQSPPGSTFSQSLMVVARKQCPRLGITVIIDGVEQPEIEAGGSRQYVDPIVRDVAPGGKAQNALREVYRVVLKRNVGLHLSTKRLHRPLELALRDCAVAVCAAGRGAEACEEEQSGLSSLRVHGPSPPGR